MVSGTARRRAHSAAGRVREGVPAAAADGATCRCCRWQPLRQWWTRRGRAGRGTRRRGRSLAVGGLVVRRQGGVGVVAVGMCVGGSVGGGRRRRRGQCGGGGRGGVGLLGIQNVNVATTAAVVVGVGQHRRAEVGRVHDELEAVDWGLLALLFFRLQLDSLALVANGRAVGQGWRRSKKKDQAQESG